MPISGLFNKTCRAKGIPLPKVEWWKVHGKESTLVATGEAKQNVQLVFTALGEKDFGKYSCVAQNWYRDERVVHVYKGNSLKLLRISILFLKFLTRFKVTKIQMKFQ